MQRENAVIRRSYSLGLAFSKDYYGYQLKKHEREWTQGDDE
jgi:hypothetical protein